MFSSRTFGAPPGVPGVLAGVRTPFDADFRGVLIIVYLQQQQPVIKILKLSSFFYIKIKNANFVLQLQQEKLGVFVHELSSSDEERKFGRDWSVYTERNDSFCFLGFEFLPL